MPTSNQYSTRQYHHGAIRSNSTPKKGGRRPKEYEGYVCIRERMYDSSLVHFFAGTFAVKRRRSR